MSPERVAFISFHACPLAAPGQGKSGGMNVYVRELSKAMGESGIAVDIYTRKHDELGDQNRVHRPQCQGNSPCGGATRGGGG